MPHVALATARRPALASLLGLLIGVMAAVAPRDAAADPEPRLLLSGTWDSAVAPTSVAPADIASWTPTPVPQMFWVNVNQGPRFVWLRRRIDIPAAWAGQRVFLKIGGAVFHPHVFVDGKLVGSQMDGWSPIEVELTAAVTPGQSHELAIRCGDESAIFAEGVPLDSRYSSTATRGKILAPVGGYRDHPGVWDDVWLSAAPPQRIVPGELVITPSVRAGELRLEGAVDGAGASARVEAYVLDGDREALHLPASPVAEGGRWSLAAPFPGARHWSPEDPHLYTLRVVLRGADGGELDRIEQRFGFREMWTQGPDFVLNGVKRHLFGASHWPPAQPQTRESIRARLESYQRAGANTFRPHIGGWQRAWYEIADELGMLTIPEAAVYTDGSGMYAYTDERFWENYRDHVARMVGAYRNHASVVMYSLGNETLFMGNERYDAELPKKLGDLARFAKTVDATRPYTYEADIDPDGAYDVIGLHYPHELPDNVAYPNTADWMGTRKRTEAGGGMLGVTRSNFFWDRTKPLYIGEYLWVPHDDYSPGSVFFGDEAYLNREKYATLAKRAASFDQTIAYRRAGVSGLCPWDESSIEKEAFRPVAAFLYDRDLRGFGGDALTLRFDVFNDRPKASSLVLRLTGPAGVVAPQEQALTLDAAAYRRVEFSITLPQADEPTTLELDAVLLADGVEVHRTASRIAVTPRKPLETPAGVTLFTYDLSGRSEGSQASLAPLASMDAAKTVLLIAGGALGGDAGDGPPVVGASRFETAAFLDFLRRGGRAVVLEQSTLRPLGLGLELVDHASTMTFPIGGEHPLLAGIDTDDLKFWRDDHYVSRHEIRRPAEHGARAIVVSGGAKSLDQAAAVELSVGAGRVVLLQALVDAKRSVEPTAAKLLQNAVNHVASADASRGETVVLAQDAAFVQRLRSLGLQFREPESALSEADLNGVTLVILQGGGDRLTASAAALAQFRESGRGRIYWASPEPAAFASLGQSLGVTGLKAEATTMSSAIHDRSSPLLPGVSREDLTFTTEALGWDRKMTLVPNARLAFAPSDVPQEPTLVLPGRELALQDATVSGDAVVFEAAGKASGVLNVERPGLYSLTVTAAVASDEDKPAPQLRIFINDVLAAVLYPTAADPTPYRVLVELPSQSNEVRVEAALSRVVEGWRPAMRTVTLSSLALGGEARFPAGVRPLTLPATLVAVGELGREVILDGTSWDADGPNALRWARYASALLANLDATFAAPEAGPAADAIPLRAFALQGPSPYSEVAPALLTLGSNGVMEASFACAASGRYLVQIRGRSTPAAGEHGRIRILVDGKAVGEIELASAQAAAYRAKPVQLTEGQHRIAVEFFNDAGGNGEDRNVFIEDVSFVKR